MKIHIIIVIFLLLLWCEVVAQPKQFSNPEKALLAYRDNLNLLRSLNTNSRSLPDFKFFLFGMGDRRKMVYQNGNLKDLRTGEIIRQWNVKNEIIVPSEYLVHLETVEGTKIQILENENGVWEISGKGASVFPQTSSQLHLPDFSGKKFNLVLKELHHEILINIIDGKPVPNLMVYEKPWFRDASMMGMVLKLTGNVSLIKNWIESIRDPFDRNNHGISEADNPGQVLFLVSLVAGKDHLVVSVILDSVRQFHKGSTENLYIEGKTDDSFHPVYQTMWLKFGLKSLGLNDPYRIPDQFDSYASLFWWDYKEEHVSGEKFEDGANHYFPYLIWAEDHLYNEHRGILGNLDYPLSWEQNASDATYSGMRIINEQLVLEKLSYPHTWHAAEMFLLLIEK